MIFKTDFSEEKLFTFRNALESYLKENILLIITSNLVCAVVILISLLSPQSISRDLDFEIIVAAMVLNLFFFVARPVQLGIMTKTKKDFGHFDFEYSDGVVTLGLRSKSTSGIFPGILKIREQKEYIGLKLTKKFNLWIPKTQFPNQE